MTKNEEDISIPRYFAGKNIFITGGTGFMGKLLIEKLLRSCPDVSNVYVLVRNKKGKTAQERVQDMTDVKIFDKLKKERPENLKKIVPIFGDVTELELGLNAEHKRLLIDKINIIYHAAASVRFDDPLKDAVIMNTRGTREVIQLAKQIKNLELLFHVSTTYCNTDRKVVGEEIYPPLANWRDAITIAEQGDSHIFDILTAKYMGKLPNTYTFTKNLAEHVVTDLCDGQVPTIIFRPSIALYSTLLVISTMKEPFPGWIDNFNGPVGVLVASGKGILRSMYTDPDIMADYIPADIVIKAILIATWVKGTEKDEEKKKKLEVFNGSNNNENNVTMGGLVEMGKSLCWDYPLNDVLWYPRGSVTNYYYYHYFRLILYHILPALAIDGLLKLTGHKTMLLKIQRKIYIANMALYPFTTNEWTFINQKTSDLEGKLLPSDQNSFGYFRNECTPYEYFCLALMGSREYLLKEPVNTFEKAKRHSRRMWFVSIICDVLFYIGLFYLVFCKFNLIGRTCHFFVSYYVSL